MTKTKFNDKDYTAFNIESILLKATATEMRDGLSWYRNARLAITNELHNWPVWKACAVVAALSPRMPWEDNIKAAVTVLTAHDAGLKPSDVKVSTFNTNKNKAFAIAAMTSVHEVSKVLKGQKTYAFYRNLMGDGDYVTIDGHATHITKGSMGSLDSAHGLTKRQYEYISGLYIDVAELWDIKPYQCQAITWLVYRRIKNEQVNELRGLL